MGVGGQRHAPAAFTPGKDPVPTVQEAGWTPGPIWTGAKNLAPTTRIRSPDRPARSKLLYRLRYPGPCLLHDVLEFPTYFLRNVPNNGKISKIMPSLGSLLELPIINHHQLRRFKSSRMWYYCRVHSSQHSFTTLGITHPTRQLPSSELRFDPEDAGATLL